jgi:serine/threonine protein kinase
MLDESHHVSLGTDSRVAEPSASLIQHFSDGIFETAQSAELTHHREVCPIRRIPYGPHTSLWLRNARQASHPNVRRVYDIEMNGQHFLTMEYVEGEDLASLLRRIGPLARRQGFGDHAPNLHRSSGPA